LVDTIVLVLLWLTVVLRLPSLARGSKQRALWSIFLTLAVAKTIVLGPVAALIEQLSSRPDLTTLLHHLLGVAGAVALLRFMSLVTDATSRRPHATLHHLGSGLVVAVLLTGLFVSSADGIYVTVDELLATPRVSVAAVAYWLVLETYLGAALVVATAMFWRISNKSSARLLRLGLRIIGFGTLLNAVYALFKIAYVVAHAAGVKLPAPLIAQLSSALLAAAVALVVVGGAVPALAAVWKVVDTHRKMRALLPLWRVMQAEFPEIVLHYPRNSNRLTAGLGAEGQLRLYRRIIEIRDGMLELSNYVPVGVADDAARFLDQSSATAADVPALVDACWIELGIRRLRSDAAVLSGRSHQVEGGASIEEEADWLSQVSRAISRSAQPARFAEWWEREQLRDASPVVV
jgi:hypothetical protein